MLLTIASHMPLRTGSSSSSAAMANGWKTYLGSILAVSGKWTAVLNVYLSVTLESSDIISASIKTGKTQNALQLGKDYKIAAYSNNLKKGTATVIFRGIGNYAGEKTVKFKINSVHIE